MCTRLVQVPFSKTNKRWKDGLRTISDILDFGFDEYSALKFSDSSMIFIDEFKSLVHDYVIMRVVRFNT